MTTPPFDYLIVGAGLYGAVFAHEALKRGKRVLVIDRRNHIGGNIHCECIEGINVHKYGAHIFHTDDIEVWEYVNRFAQFNRFTNSPLAVSKGEVFNLPFNMNTFRQLWGVRTPAEAQAKIAEQVKASGITHPENLEEQAIFLVGEEIYRRLIQGYTEKQWGKKATDLPPFIIRRLPLRFTFDNNYFNDRFQGIPVGGYNLIVEKLLAGIEVRLGVDYLLNRNDLGSVAGKTIYTGMIDEFFGFQYGRLEYRSLNFVHELLEMENFQGNAVVNYTDADIPYTRIIEHKHFEFGTQPKTLISREFPLAHDGTNEPYYPVNTPDNMMLYEKYKALSGLNPSVIFAGRLGEYKYYDMHQIVRKAMDMARNEFGNRA
jgi:UDP-galactopyranose mutase